MELITEPLTVDTSAAPKPESYVACRCCGSILGFRAHVGKALFVYVYAYPAAGICPGLAQRRVCARVLEGDLLCSICGSVQAVEVERKWER